MTLASQTTPRAGGIRLRRGLPARHLQHRACRDRPATPRGARRARRRGRGVRRARGGRRPAAVRLLVALPAAAAASGYLQARFRFCAGFGSRGIYNFGELGKTIQVEDADARRRDRARATQIGLASVAIGVAVGLVAVLVPR